MPRKWVYPEVAFTYKGVTIFHAYKDGDYENVSADWYGLDQGEDELAEFDVRELKAQLKGTLHTNCSRDDVFRAAIDAGLLKNPENIDHYSKHVIVRYVIRCGEYEFNANPAILDMHPDADVADIVHMHFADFWGEETYQEDEDSSTFFCPTGEVALTISSFLEISLNDVEVMQAHGTHVWGRRTFDAVSDQ